MMLRLLMISRLLPVACLATATFRLPAMAQSPCDQICHSPETSHPDKEDTHSELVTGAVERWAAGGTDFFQ